ncbi:MAG: bacterioferritin-associated ferredoxin [Pirellulaceae bacterium]
MGLSDLDQPICLCFHVTRRKIVNYLRVEKPRRAAQLSDCSGAGTGCGWCRPYLERLFQEAVSQGQTHADIPSAEEYARGRGAYIDSGQGVAPPD